MNTRSIVHGMSIAFQAAMILIMLDLFILFAAIGQIALEGKSGHWNPFWSAQAEFIVEVLQSASR